MHTVHHWHPILTPVRCLWIHYATDHANHLTYSANVALSSTGSTTDHNKSLEKTRADCMPKIPRTYEHRTCSIHSITKY